MSQSYIYIYGKHTVREALAYNKPAVAAVYGKAEALAELPEHSLSGVPMVEKFQGAQPPVTLDEGAVHQGLVAKLNVAKVLTPYDTFIDTLEVSPSTSIVMIGEIHDPHNVGAIIRSAAAFGVAGVCFPKHRQASITPTVLKVSVGMGFRVPLVEVGNVNQTLLDLKKRDFFVYGLAGESGALSLTEESFTKPSVFVCGNEADGLREKTRVHCDQLLSIPMHGRCESLNASVSTAVCLYAWSAQHKEALKKYER